MFTALIDAEVSATKTRCVEYVSSRSRIPKWPFFQMMRLIGCLERLEDARRVAVLCLSTGARWGLAGLRGEHIVGNRVMFFNTKNGKSRAVLAVAVLCTLISRKPGYCTRLITSVFGISPGG